MFGERGVGKTSIARVSLKQISENGFYYSASTTDSFESIMGAILSSFGAGWAATSRDSGNTTDKNAGLSIPGVRAGLAHGRSSIERQAPLVETFLSPQEIATRLSSETALVVIDDFERIARPEVRAIFADLIKKLSDNDSGVTLLLVGIAANVSELIDAHQSAQRSILEIPVPRLRNAEVRNIIMAGMDALNINIEPDAADQIVEFSANFPYYTHLLCEGAVISLINRPEPGLFAKPTVGRPDITEAIHHAIENTQHWISEAYDHAIRNIHNSPRFKFTLYAVASFPDEPVPYNEICKWVGGAVNAPGRSVNVSHQLAALQHSGIIEKQSMGFYRFCNPILKAYVILRARADTPDNELAAIDVQIEQVKKRINRLADRTPQAT